MRIYSLSKVIGIPIAIVTAYLMYAQFFLHENYGFWFLIPVIAIVVLLIFWPQIDYWYHKTNPVPLDKEIIDWLERYSRFYQSLPEDDREEYERRMSLYLEARAFQSVGSEMGTVPEDIKAAVASSAIQVAFQDSDFLIGDFDRIYIYKHPFPTPNHKFLHSVETQTEDGVLIFSLEQLVLGILKSDTHYNVGMHGYVEAYIRQHPALDYPITSEETWNDIEKVSGWSKKQILATTGFNSLDVLIVLITCYHTFPDKFSEKLPAISAHLNSIFSKNST